MRRAILCLAIILAAGSAMAATQLDGDKLENSSIYIATAILSEAPETADHECRVAIAIEAWLDPVAFGVKLTPYLRYNGVTAESEQALYHNTMSAYVTTEVMVRKARGICTEPEPPPEP